VPGSVVTGNEAVVRPVQTGRGVGSVPNDTSYDVAPDADHLSVGLAATSVAPTAGKIATGVPGRAVAPRITAPPTAMVTPHAITPRRRSTRARILVPRG